MSFPKYPEYKDSGVEWLGEVPAHWQIRKFRHVFQESSEKIDEKPVGVMLSVSGYRGVEVKQYEDDNKRRTHEELIGYRIVRPGQLVVNTMWLNYAGLGVSEYVGHVSPAYRSYWILPDLESRFAHHLMRSQAYVTGYTKYLTGIRPNSLQMSRDDLLSLPVLVPSVSEQRVIAAFLDHETGKIDALIEEQRRLIELLKEKRQAVISHAVTKGLDPNVPMKDSGVEWLGEVPAQWDVVMLRRVLEGIEQGWSPECHSTPAENGMWGILKAGAVNNGVYRESENKALPHALHPRPDLEVCSGDVLMCRASGSTDLIGSVAYVESSRGNLMLSDKLFRLIFSLKVSAKFVARTLGSNPLRRQIEQSINGAEGLANNLSQATIKGLYITVPPLHEQDEIVGHIEQQTGQIEGLLDASKNAVDVLQERRSSLISAAVTGKIDVRGWAGAAEQEESELAMVAEEQAGYSAQGGAT
ncbi:restriction endonuclease subunit S [Thioalkalivibrio sp. ALJ3]|uniref:restriction endonuclease subunit S n=1 Tax=Thioalkalivibrio sp. ALJ3 TaxID=1240557 RepID=UPI00035E6062|nr:restriction endonuclease subunit S [Thioalkalivibrio sp. ALJ3]